MKTFADIEKIFYREKRPYYVVKDSRGARKSTTPSDIMDIADEEQRLKDSYEFLTEAVADFEDGKYKILLRTSENAGKGELSYDFQIGDSTPSVSRQSKDTPSIGGFSIAGLETIMGLVNGGRSEADRLRDEKHDLKLQLVQKDFEIQNLKNAQIGSTGTESWSDVIKGVVKEYFPDILDKYAPQKTEVSSVRGKDPVPPNAGKKQKETPKDETKTAEGQELTQDEVKDKLTVIFERTATLFEGYNPILVLEVVLEMSEKNPLVISKVKRELAKRYETAK
jgi:hypothetical protein